MQTKFGKIYHADCVEFMQSLPDGCVNLIFADPPYNVGKASWDKIEGYHEFNARWIAEASRVLAPNGAFWVSHSEPEQLILMSQLIAKYGRKRINWITWWKHNGKREVGRNNALKGNDGLRSWFPCGEYLIFHSNEGEWVSKQDETRGFIFESIRSYLDEERKRAGVPHRKVISYLGMTGHDSHFFSPVQWKLPLKHQYLAMRTLFCQIGNGSYLRREYESLRREYESLRYTFRPDEKVSSLWQFAPGKSSWHPTPKPEGLLRRIVYSTSNPGDVVFEPFAGTAPACKVAEKLGRQWFGTDTIKKHVEKATQELDKVRGKYELFR